MQRKQRDTTIFSLSALDLFCSAMGVFMVLCFIVFPFYQKESPTPEPAPQPAPAPVPAPPAPQPPPPTPAPEKQVIAGLTIALSWDTGFSGSSPLSLDDIDLHVHAKDAQGRELHYYYEKRAYPSSPATLVTDSRWGGNEVWLHPAVTPGEYKVSFVYFASNPVNNSVASSQMKLKLIIVHGSGETKEYCKSIPYSSLHPDQHREYPWVTIKVRENGDVDFQEN